MIKEKNFLLCSLIFFMFVPHVNAQMIYGTILLNGVPATQESILFLNSDGDLLLEEKTNKDGQYLVHLLNADRKVPLTDVITQIVCFNSTRCPQKIFRINVSLVNGGFEMNHHIDTCTPSYSLILSFDVLDSESSGPSTYQDYKDLKEDDVLNLKELIVQNNVDCRIRGYDIDLDVVTPNRIISSSLVPIIEVPPLDEREQYVLTLIDRSALNIPNIPLEFNIYEPSIDYVLKKAKIAFLGQQDLYEPGVWTFEATSGKLNFTRRNEVNVLLKNKEGQLVQPRLKIYDKKQQRSLELARSTIIVSAIVSFITTLFGILAGYVIGRNKELRDRKLLLHNLKFQLDDIFGAISGHKKDLKKGIPSYPLPKLHAMTYLSGLDFKKLSDSKIKRINELIHGIENKIININHMIDKAADSLVLDNAEALKMIRSELVSEGYKYHSHLEKMIQELKKLIPKSL